MKLSVHSVVRGKPVPKQSVEGRTYLTHNNKIVNMGYGWLNIDCTWEQAFELITSDGMATSAELKNDHRNEQEYVSRQLCMVDIDNGMTLFELFDNDFYNEFGSGFYATASHTDTNHRFRIMFVLEEPITDVQQMRKIIRGLLTIFSAGDVNCKDASRIYYGVKDCVIKEFRNNILPKYITDALIDMIDSEDVKTQKSYTYTYNQTEYDEEFVDVLLKRIQNTVGNLRGDYNAWLTIAWATCNTIGVHNAKALMSRYWPEKTKKEMKSLESWKQYNSPTVGTLIKLSNIDKQQLKLLDIQQQMRNLQRKK
jgi:hypothetical protein